MFEFEEYQLVFRPLLLEKHRYLLVDSLSSKSDLVNFLLDRNQYFVKGEVFSLRDNYVLNTGGKRRKRETKLAMSKVMAPQDGLIFSCPIETIDFEDLIVNFLDWVVLRENAKSIIKAGEERFKQIAADFQNAVSVQLEESAFKFGRINSNYMFIKDKHGLIGDIKAHYELVINAGELGIELHFEQGNKKEKDQFQKLIGPVPDRLKWFPWFSSKSICFNETISFDRPNVIPFLLDQLSFLEKELGDKVREVLKNGGKEMNDGAKNTSNKKDTMKKEPINQILYGPPGTGKTYHTKNCALSIIENKTIDQIDSESRELVNKKYNDLLITDWEEGNGQIGFVTFHQSMSYEDFIEGIKPDLSSKGEISYDIIPGIFKGINSLALDNWKAFNNSSDNQLPFEEAFNLMKEEWEEYPEMEFPLKTKGKEFTIVSFSKTSIRFKKASGGTGHTLSIATLSDYYYNKRSLKLTGVGIYYPGILDKLNSYKSVEKITKQLKQYVLIIDEINRGNVSQIFGELITLIEHDKRLGGTERLELTLPYSKEPFIVAPNLHIIGTMNTADRSVEALDTALRRRFSFKEMMPDSDLIKQELGDKNEWNGIQISEVLKTINKRIQVLVDRDHTIGHSYFLGLKESEKFEEDLKAVFTDKIIPLLQEYFFNDYVKIGMVLGKGFIKSYSNRGIKFAEIENSVGSDYEDGNGYEIIPSTDIKLKEAIDQLMLRSE
ncbi:AAA family ATPase [bacterium SCSIO 12643]|nr:AAA family ATPase [bacterium SCSIO 12643]